MSDGCATVFYAFSGSYENSASKLPEKKHKDETNQYEVQIVSLALTPLAARAQPTERVRRIGFLSAARAGSEVDDAFRQDLREQGYVDGQNLLVEWRFVEGEMIRSRGSLRISLVLRSYQYPLAASTTRLVDCFSLQC